MFTKTMCLLVGVSSALVFASCATTKTAGTHPEDMSHEEHLAAAEKESDHYTNIRVAIASVIKRPERLTGLEDKVKDLHSMSDEQIKDAVQAEVKELRLVGSAIFSEEYRREVLVVKLARCLIALKAGGN